MEGLPACGGVAEWTKAVVLKTTEQQCSGGSNPSPSVSELLGNESSALRYQVPTNLQEVCGSN